MVFHSRHLPTHSDVGPRVSHPVTMTRQTTPTSMRLLRSMNTAFAFGAPVSLSLHLCHPCATASSSHIAPNLCHSASPHYFLTGLSQSGQNDHNITINFTPTTLPVVNGPSQSPRRPESRGPLVKHTGQHSYMSGIPNSFQRSAMVEAICAPSGTLLCIFHFWFNPSDIGELHSSSTSTNPVS